MQKYMLHSLPVIGFLTLVAPDGRMMRSSDTLFGLEDGDCLTAIAQRPRLTATVLAFALWLFKGDRIITWGDKGYGGDCTAVEKVISARQVVQVQATDSAFAAVFEDGSVVTWGNQNHGGDSRAVQDQLKDVKQVEATSGAFVAILNDGRAVTWGHSDLGGNSEAVELVGVKEVKANDGAFAAILWDGSLVTWGARPNGGYRRMVRKVRQVEATESAFAAIMEDGSVSCWWLVLKVLLFQIVVQLWS